MQSGAGGCGEPSVSKTFYRHLRAREPLINRNCGAIISAVSGKGQPASGSTWVTGANRFPSPIFEPLLRTKPGHPEPAPRRVRLLIRDDPYFQRRKNKGSDMPKKVKRLPTHALGKHTVPASHKAVPPRSRAVADTEPLGKEADAAPLGSCWPVPDGPPPAARPKPVRNGSASRRDFMTGAHENWDDEGGAPRQDSMHSEYGRRIETDGSWTIYHVFTGVPATIGGDRMQGMSATAAADHMMKTNSDNSGRRAAQTGILKVNFLSACWTYVSRYFGGLVMWLSV